MGQLCFRVANQVHHSDLQAAVAKLTYKEGCAALYTSAKEHIGDGKVRAICQAEVHLHFFRGRSLKNGKDWLDDMGVEKLAGIHVLDTFHCTWSTHGLPTHGLGTRWAICMCLCAWHWR